nr:Dentin sialoprotein [Ipomoea batatas]
MERTRVPFQKYRHPVDRGEGFMPPTSHRFSPHHHQDSRWVGNRNPVNDHLRHRRSNMGNIRRTNQRFDDAGSGELKLDDYFRPEGRITSARFPPQRGFKLEESYNFKRHDGRYEEMIQEARHCDARRHGDDNYKAACNPQTIEEFHCAADQRTLPKTARKDVSS